MSADRLPEVQLEPQELQALRRRIAAELASVSGRASAEELRRRYIGREGTVKALLGQVGSLPKDVRSAVAQELNQLKSLLTESLRPWLEPASEDGDTWRGPNPTLPGTWHAVGHKHPITLVEERLRDIMGSMGFDVADGPEIETEYFCFDSLNIPPEHPARDLQDTFFVKPGLVLRTHTTSVQARLLSTGANPVRAVSFGRVYRNEAVDAQHLAMFNQFEGIWLEQGLTLADLLGLLKAIAAGIYGPQRRTRFKPKYYPYTEPSLGLDVACQMCEGTGDVAGNTCDACHGVGWVTIVGAGMVHKNVLEEFKYDCSSVRGIAFGIGTSRLAAQLYGATRIKQLYENDLRVIQQCNTILRASG